MAALFVNPRAATQGRPYKICQKFHAFPASPGKVYNAAQQSRGVGQLNRREFLRAGALAGAGLFAGPMINRGRFRLFADDRVRSSTPPAPSSWSDGRW